MLFIELKMNEKQLEELINLSILGGGNMTATQIHTIGNNKGKIEC
jgi:hypothetical protein